MPSWRLLLRLLHCAAVLALCFAGTPLHAQDGEKIDAGLDSLLKAEIPAASRRAFQVSTASKGDQTGEEVAAAVIVVTSADIERHGYLTIAEVLNSVSGFYITDDRTYSYVGVRGFSRPSDYNNRLLLLLDGHPLNENVYGSASVGNETPLNMDAIERIEIARGPFPMYGNYAMFAVVNIVQKKGRSLDGVRVSVDGGSFGAARAGLAYGKELPYNWDLLATVTAGRSDGEQLYFPEFDRANDTAQTSDGWARNLDGERYYGAGLSVSNRSLKIAGGFMRRDKSIPTAAWDVPFNAPGNRCADERGFTELGYSARLTPSLAIESRANFDYYGYDADYPYTDSRAAENAFSRWAGIRTQATWDVETSNRVTAGLEFSRTFSSEYTYWTTDSTVIHFNADFSTVTGFLQDEWQIFEQLSLGFGLRYDDQSGMARSMAPRASIIYLPSSRSSVKLLYAEGFRNPSPNERFYFDPTSDFKISEGLRPERIASLDLATEHAVTEQVTAKVALFRYQLTNLIDQMYDPADGLLQFRNSNAIVASGLEAELYLRSERGLSGYAGYSYVHARQEADDARLSNSPVHQCKLGASLPFDGIGTLAAEARYESERETLPVDPTVPSSVLRTRSCTVVNLSLTTVPVAGLRFWIRANNLLDTQYSFPGGYEHVMRSIPQPRRTLTAGVRATW